MSAFHGRAAFRHGAGFHNGPAAHGQSTFHAGPTTFHGGPHGSGAPHFAIAGPRGGAPHALMGSRPHGGGAPHFAMGHPTGAAGHMAADRTAEGRAATTADASAVAEPIPAAKSSSPAAATGIVRRGPVRRQMANTARVLIAGMHRREAEIRARLLQ